VEVDRAEMIFRLIIIHDIMRTERTCNPNKEPGMLMILSIIKMFLIK